MQLIELGQNAISKCNLCPSFCNKKNIVGSGDVLYIIPYESDDDDILARRGVVIREVACENGLDYLCNIYVRSLLNNFEKVVATPDYVSKLIGRKVEDFEKIRFQGRTVLATYTPCDIRVKQELGE